MASEWSHRGKGVTKPSFGVPLPWCLLGDKRGVGGWVMLGESLLGVHRKDGFEENTECLSHITV